MMSSDPVETAAFSTSDSISPSSAPFNGFSFGRFRLTFRLSDDLEELDEEDDDENGEEDGNEGGSVDNLL